MTYQNELNTNERNNMSDDIRYTHWIIIGVVTLAIVIVIAIFTSTGNYPDHQTTSTNLLFLHHLQRLPSTGRPQFRPTVKSVKILHRKYHPHWLAETSNVSGR